MESQFDCVFWHRENLKWSGEIQHNNNMHHCGYWKTEKEAALAVNMKCREFGIPLKNPSLGTDIQPSSNKSQESPSEDTNARYSGQNATNKNLIQSKVGSDGDVDMSERPSAPSSIQVENEMESGAVKSIASSKPLPERGDVEMAEPPFEKSSKIAAIPRNKYQNRNKSLNININARKKRKRKKRNQKSKPTYEAILKMRRELELINKKIDDNDKHLIKKDKVISLQNKKLKEAMKIIDRQSRTKRKKLREVQRLMEQRRRKANANDKDKEKREEN